MNPVRLLILVLAALSALLVSPAPAGVDDLSPKAARVEAWWLASAFRFEEARATLGSVVGVDKKEIELLAKLDEFSTSLIDLLVTRGKGATFKLRGGGVLKGKPVELKDGNTIVLHNKKTLPLTQLNWESVAILSKSAAKRKGPEADALCAVAYLLGGVPNKTKGALRKATGPLAEAAKSLAESWPEMDDEFAARTLAGLVIDGDVNTFRAAAEQLVTAYTDTEVYARLKDDLRAAVVPLLEEEGKIGAGLNALEDQDLGRNKRRLVYGFVSVEECADWDLISFEEATADLNPSLRSFLISQANALARRAGTDPMDVEQRTTIEEDSFLLHPGSAIRHCLRFKGSIKVTCEVNKGYEDVPFPYLIAHGHEDHSMLSFYWGLYVGQKGGIVLEPQIEKKESWSLSGPTMDVVFEFKVTRQGAEASMEYEGEDCGKVSAEENDGGYLILGAIGTSPATISRMLIEGEVEPESLANLARARIESAVTRLFPDE